MKIKKIFWLFSLTLLSSFSCAYSQVQKELKTWLKSLSKFDFDFSSSSSSINSCYTENDILPKTDPKFIVLKDKTRIEAQEFVKFGIPEGPGKLIHGHHHHASNDSFLKGNFKNGCFEGIVQGYEYLPLDGIPDDPSYDEALVTSIAYYKHGFPIGPSWKILYSPDGIIFGYLYSENAQIPKLANQDVDTT